MDGGVEDILAQVRELESRDCDVAARLDTLAILLERVDVIRARARNARDSLAAIPGERSRLEALLEEASAREANSRVVLGEAEQRLEEASRGRRASESAREEAERELRRATVALADATSARTRLVALRAALVRDEAALRAESALLQGEAAACAHEVAALPRISDSGRSRPGPSLDEIDEWGARAHAALFVVRSGLETERERLVHEANVLAAVNLGDQGGVASVALLRRRVEESLRAG